MRRRQVSLAVSAAALAVAGALLAGCGSQGTVGATPQTIQGSVPKQTTPTTPKGNPANGKTVFISVAGCAGCHAFKPAGSTAKVGPNLDQLADYAKKANQPLAEFARTAIVSPPPGYVPPGFKNVMPTTFGQTLKPKQIADLVAFLTQKS